MKNISVSIILVLTIFSLPAWGQNTITTNTLTQTSFCAGGNIVVEYSTTGTFSAGCTFTAELSDQSGNFNSPVAVGSMPFNTGIIAGTIPSNTPFGFNYRVRVVASNPATIGSVSSTSLIITSTASSATIVANPSTQVCHGDTISLWATFNASYYWSNGETTQAIRVTESGAYTVTVKNYVTGCEVTSNPMVIVVHPTPVVNLGPDFGFCAGQPITLNAGPGFSSYLWSDSTLTQFLNVDSSGVFAVMVSDSFGCTGADTIQSVLHQNPVVHLGADTVLCGNSLLLSAGAGFEAYNWNNGSSFNPAYLVETSGSYMLAVEDSNGCKTSDTILVNVHPLPVVNLGNDLSACGNSILLNAGSGYADYDWNNGYGSNQFFPAATTGTYFVKVTDQFGCALSDTINVTIRPLPDIDLGPDSHVSMDDFLVLDAGSGYSSYQWSNGETSESVVIDSRDYPAGLINVSVVVTDSNGCVNADQINITILASEGMNGFVAFPNPFHEVLNIISAYKAAEAQPVFYDLLGKYYYPEFTRTSSGFQINRGDLSNGCYMLFLSDESGLYEVGKVVVY